MHPGIVAAADWSGAARGEDATLWVAEWSGTAGAVVAVTRRTRRGATDRPVELADADAGLVAGLDFSFSLPAWWLAEAGVRSAGELWADRDRLEGWLAACDPPFWGRPGRRRPHDGERQWRRTELAAPVRPRSTFQIGGAGAVGTASLRGMPHLAQLRAAGVAVWPFDPWATPAVVEVWPRLAIGSLVKSSAAARAGWVDRHRHLLAPSVADAASGSPDALDATAAALDLAGRGGASRPDLERHGVIGLEGWIDGVSPAAVVAPRSPPRPGPP